MQGNYRDRRRGVLDVDRARRLRRTRTDAERRLWGLLRSRQVGAAKFRRQHEFGPFVLDF